MARFGRRPTSRGTIEIDAQGHVVGLSAVPGEPLVRQSLDSSSPSVREQHHAEILASFETATAELAHAERVKVRAAEVAFEAGRTVDQAREAVEAQRRLLRRVAEGHI